MAEIVPVTSESLEATVRNLLPSQRGFGEDLQASNVITPIIDLTPTAEGSILRVDLQTALAFGSNTPFSQSNGTLTLTSTTGFFRVIGISSIEQSALTLTNSVNLNDGATTKAIYQHTVRGSTTADSNNSVPFDIVVFIRPGDTLSVTAGGTATGIDGSFRQIADVNGNLVVPVGYTSE